MSEQVFTERIVFVLVIRSLAKAAVGSYVLIKNSLDQLLWKSFFVLVKLLSFDFDVQLRT